MTTVAIRRRHFRNALNTNRYSLRSEIVALFNKYENRPNCLIRIKIDKIFSELKRESFEHETANNAFRTRTDYTVAIQWKLLIQGNSCLYHLSIETTGTMTFILQKKKGNVKTKSYSISCNQKML